MSLKSVNQLDLAKEHYEDARGMYGDKCQDREQAKQGLKQAMQELEQAKQKVEQAKQLLNQRQKSVAVYKTKMDDAKERYEKVEKSLDVIDIDEDVDDDDDDDVNVNVEKKRGPEGGDKLSDVAQSLREQSLGTNSSAKNSAAPTIRDYPTRLAVELGFTDDWRAMKRGKRITLTAPTGEKFKTRMAAMKFFNKQNHQGRDSTAATSSTRQGQNSTATTSSTRQGQNSTSPTGNSRQGKKSTSPTGNSHKGQKSTAPTIRQLEDSTARLKSSLESLGKLMKSRVGAATPSPSVAAPIPQYASVNFHQHPQPPVYQQPFAPYPPQQPQYHYYGDSTPTQPWGAWNHRNNYPY